MIRREQILLGLVVGLGVSFLMSLSLLILVGRDLKNSQSRLDHLGQDVDRIEGDLAVLEPFMAEQLQKDQETFNIVLSDFEQKAELGEYPAGQTFDEAILPYLYKFYVASYLGYLDKKVALSLVVRARNFVGDWKHTFAESDRAVQSLYIQLLTEIENDKQRQEPSGGEKVLIKTTSGSNVVFLLLRKPNNNTVSFIEAKLTKTISNLSCSNSSRKS